MSRSGYFDDDGDDPLATGRWRGAVKSAMNGKRGQAMLSELLVALDDMPEKRLISDSLVNADGQFCTLGVLGNRRGIDMSRLDPEDYSQVAAAFDVNEKVVQEIVFENDERNYSHEYVRRIHPEIGPPVPYFLDSVRIEKDEDAERWKAMRKWVFLSLKESSRPQNFVV